MNENKTTVRTPEEDYRLSYMPMVHRIGRTTMSIALVLSFLPVIYFAFVKGYTLPFSTYLSGIIGVSSIGIGMWISEPEVYWPVLGSAGGYISCLSGNTSGMRFPVATTVQRQMNADITTPRGQVITVVGLVASVVMNLVILLVIVLAGSWIISVLPEVVLSAFGFCVISMLGAMIMMNLGAGNSSAGEMVKTAASKLPYIVYALIAYFLCNKLVPALMSVGMIIAVGGAILIGYVLYRRDLKKAEAADEQ